MTSITLSVVVEIRALLQAHITATPDQMKRFFKTNARAYGEHDQFLGIMVPALRKISKQFIDVELGILRELLLSKFNEERLLALIILVEKYKQGNNSLKEEIYQFYLRHLKYVNNWNLVDSSAHLILGAHIFNKSHDILLQLSQSEDLWERRIAIVATWYFIKQGELNLTFKLAKLLLSDKQDLIHKSVGWMLREAGKRDEERLIHFLMQHSKKMPRTMLRYAVERLSIQQKAGIYPNKNNQ